MRLLTMLATAVLLAACVHDTDDFNLFLTESGVSLTYYIGSDGDAGLKNHDDPWDTITEKFGMESVHTGKKKDENVGGDDDPWNTIHDNFCLETVHTGSGKAHDDPWDTINEGFPTESTHTGKKRASFLGHPISEMLFVSFGGGVGEADDPWTRILEFFPEQGVKATADLTLVEVRGRIGRFEFEEGGSLFAVGVPENWKPGMKLLATGYLLHDPKALPLAGVVVWEVDLNLLDNPYPKREGL